MTAHGEGGSQKHQHGSQSGLGGHITAISGLAVRKTESLSLLQARTAFSAFRKPEQGDLNLQTGADRAASANGSQAADLGRGDLEGAEFPFPSLSLSISIDSEDAARPVSLQLHERRLQPSQSLSEVGLCQSTGIDSLDGLAVSASLHQVLHSLRPTSDSEKLDLTDLPQALTRTPHCISISEQHTIDRQYIGHMLGDQMPSCHISTTRLPLHDDELFEPCHSQKNSLQRKRYDPVRTQGKVKRHATRLPASSNQLDQDLECLLSWDLRSEWSQELRGLSPEPTRRHAVLAALPESPTLEQEFHMRPQEENLRDMSPGISGKNPATIQLPTF